MLIGNNLIRPLLATFLKTNENVVLTLNFNKETLDMASAAEKFRILVEKRRKIVQ